MKYLITGRDAILGVFEADSPEEAIEAMLAQAGSDEMPDPDLTVVEVEDSETP